MVVERYPESSPWIPRRDMRFSTEIDSAHEFDRRIEACGLFERSFVEVGGYYIAHRPNRERKLNEKRGNEENAARIDRVLLPGPRLRDLGWSVPIGVELKKSDADFGHAISQAIDYTYCVFNVGPYWMHFERIFVWPFRLPGGPAQSIMLQNGVGVCCGEQIYGSSELENPLIFSLERRNLVVRNDGSIEECHPWTSGNKKGSR